jgi:hypothetical protein
MRMVLDLLRAFLPWDACGHLKHDLASLVIGPALAISIDGRRRRALPVGVIGRTKDGVYVYDLDQMKGAR